MKTLWTIINVVISAVLGAILWIICMAIKGVSIGLGYVLTVASVIVGGIARFAGGLVSVATIILILVTGFSPEYLLGFAAAVVLITAKKWILKLAYLFLDISVVF